MFTKTNIGEVQMKMIEDVKSTEELTLFLRIGWGAETTSRLTINPASDLRVGDELKVTLEKLVEVKEEPKPAETAAAAGEAPVAGMETATCEAGAAPGAVSAPTAEPIPVVAQTSVESDIEEKKEEEPPLDKIGEVKGRLVTDVSQDLNPRLLFRIVYKNKSDEAPIKLAEELKLGDDLQATVIRTLKAPEPKPEENAAQA